MSLDSCTGEMVGSIRCEWTFHEYNNFIEKSGEYQFMSELTYKTNDKTQWTQTSNSSVISEQCKNDIWLYLMLKSSCRPEVRARLILSILKANGCAAVIKRVTSIEESQYTRFIDSLRIVVEMSVLAGSFKTSVDCIHVPSLECSFSNDLGRLFEDHHLSDVILSTPSKEYKAHKAILAARSPVFAAMFQHEMEEKKSNSVHIADVGEEVLEEVLSYMYTGKATNLDKMADKLLIAADKYDMKRLKALCEKSLCDNLALGNAADALVIADLHGAEVLKAQAIIFINRHMDEITETAGWKKIQLPHHLVTEIFRCTEKSLIKRGMNKKGPLKTEINLSLV